MLSILEELRAVRDIEQLMARRLRAMDTKDWELYAGLHAEDVVLESFAGFPDDAKPKTGNESGHVTGRDQVTRSLRSLMEEPVPMTSAHHVHSKEIDFTSATTAVGIWAMEDWLWWNNGGTEEYLNGFGHYHEEYRREGEVWRISRRRLARSRVVTSPRFYDKMRMASPSR